jgi:hypothetical protein
VELSGPRFGVHFAGVLLFSILLGLTWVLHIEANGPGGPVSRLLAVDESNLAATVQQTAPETVGGLEPGTSPAPVVPGVPDVSVDVPGPAPSGTGPSLAGPAPVVAGSPAGGDGVYVGGNVGIGSGPATVIEERTTTDRGPTPANGAGQGDRDVGVPTLANPDSNPMLGPGP